MLLVALWLWAVSVRANVAATEDEGLLFSDFHVLRERSHDHLAASLIEVLAPTVQPTVEPTEVPTLAPTADAAAAASAAPSPTAPTEAPTFTPTRPPSFVPTLLPTATPSLTSQPSRTPTRTPTTDPTAAPSSLAPTPAPSYQNRPIIRVECNITMYNISASSLGSEELAVIERAASIMLRVPLDRVLSTRWTVVGTTTARRGRMLTTAEASDEPPATGPDEERIESPETLWDVEAALGDVTERRPGDAAAVVDDPVDGGVFYDSLLDRAVSGPPAMPNRAVEEAPTPDGDVAAAPSNGGSLRVRPAADVALRRPPLPGAVNDVGKAVALGLRQLLRQAATLLSMTAPPSESSESPAAAQPPAAAAVTAASMRAEASTVYYEYFLTSQVEVLMVDFPEYRSITNGTRLMNFLRQRVRSSLRTGNFSRNVQRLWRAAGHTDKASSLYRAAATRVVLRNEGLVFAPTFAPTAAPIFVTANPQVATSLASFVVAAVFGVLGIGAVVVVYAANRAEHLQPPKPVELVALSSAARAKGKRSADEEAPTDDADGGARGQKASSKARGDKARGKGGGSGGKVATTQEDDDFDPQLSPNLKKKPQRSLR